MPDVKESVTRKVGPLPVWGWAAVGVGGFLVWRVVSGTGNGSTAAGVASQGAVGDGSGGGGGGGSSDLPTIPDIPTPGAVIDTSAIDRAISALTNSVQQSVSSISDQIAAQPSLAEIVAALPVTIPTKVSAPLAAPLAAPVITTQQMLDAIAARSPGATPAQVAKTLANDLAKGYTPTQILKGSSGNLTSPAVGVPSAGTTQQLLDAIAARSPGATPAQVANTLANDLAKGYTPEQILNPSGGSSIATPAVSTSGGGGITTQQMLAAIAARSPGATAAQVANTLQNDLAKGYTPAQILNPSGGGASAVPVSVDTTAHINTPSIPAINVSVPNPTPTVAAAPTRAQMLAAIAARSPGATPAQISKTLANDLAKGYSPQQIVKPH